MLPRRVIPFINRSNSHRKGAERSQTVFQIGRDQELLRLRAKIISCAGYTVQSMTPDQVTAEIGEVRGTRVWVFCHTLDFYELALFAVAIRNAHPADKLLRLAGLDDVGQAPGLFDELLKPIMGVDELLRVVASLAQRLRSGNRFKPLRHRFFAAVSERLSVRNDEKRTLSTSSGQALRGKALIHSTLVRHGRTRALRPKHFSAACEAPYPSIN